MTARTIARRVIYGCAIGILISWIANELSFYFLKSDSARAPETIELVIPAGTAQQIRSGSAAPSIPEGMVFVVGDTFVVRNMDTQNHQLGPLFIPAGSSATMTFETPQKYSYACSFSSAEFLGIDVQLPITAWTRLTGAVLAGLPLGVLIALYGLVARPPTEGRRQP